MNKDRFHKRSGTTDQGKDYENLLVAYYSLRLVLSAEVADFKISSNDDQYGNFDDLVIQTTYRNGTSTQFNIQAKHKQSNKSKNLLLEALRAEKGRFSIKKRFEEYEQNTSEQNANLVLLTNRTFQISDETLVRPEDCFGIYITRHEAKFEIVNTANDKQNSAYRFYIKEHDDVQLKKEDITKIKQYEDFLNQFYLYTNQKNTNEIRDVILNLFQDHFKCDASFVKNYLEFVINWSNHDGKKDKLTKEFLQLKLAECLLSPYILTPSDAKDTDRSRLLKDGINAFDITIISDVHITQNFYRTNSTDLNTLNKTGLKYQIISKYVKNLCELSRLQRATISWLLNECPLILRVTTRNEVSIFQAINLCQNEPKKKFILMGSIKKAPANSKTLRTLSDLYNNCLATYEKIVSTFRCSFHGQLEATLDEIISGDDHIRNAFTIDELIFMMDGSFNFGTPKETASDFYIERKLTKITLDFDFIKKFGDVNPIVISCNGKLHVLKGRLGDINFLSLDELDYSDSIDSPRNTAVDFFSKQYIYVATEGCPQETFNKICEDHSTRPCHHLQIDRNNNLEWLESSRSIEDLRNFQTRIRHFVKEKHVFDKHQLNIICADAGMGKSLMMSNIKNNASSKFWIVKIVLREHTTVLQESTTNGDFLNLLLERSNLSEFEKRIFDVFKSKQRLILIWDGLDEISKQLFDNVVELIQKSRDQGFVQWITARSGLKIILEDRLNVFARNIKPFGTKDQQMYITKRLHDVEDIEKLTKEIMKFLELLGNPLQIFMLTELYKHNERVCQKLLSYKFSSAELFQYFVDEKFNFYYKKANIDTSNNVARKILEEHKLQRLEEYEIVALTHCLPLTIVEELKLPKMDHFLRKLQKENDCFGILQITNDTPNFAHRTQTEYFVALWLSKHYAKVPNLENFFFEENWKGVRFMFDLIMAKDCPLHVAVLHKNIEGIHKYLDSIRIEDKVGRTPLHIAASWGEPHEILSAKLEKKKIVINLDKGLAVKQDGSDYLQMLVLLMSKCDLKRKDKLFQYDCLQYADQSLSLSALNMFAKAPQDLQRLKNVENLASALSYIIKFGYSNLFQALTEVPYVETNLEGSLLHLCARFNRPHFLVKFLKNPLYRKNINKTDQKKWAPIHYAACYGHLDMLKSLQNMGADIHLGVKNGDNSPILVASQYGQIEILKYLIENKADVNGCNGTGWTPLLVATQKMNFPVVKLLMDHNADVNRTNNEGYGPLYVAVRKGNLHLVRFLLSKNAKVNQLGTNGEGPLYMAAKLGHLKIAKLLIQKKANVNASKTNGWTPLMIATRSGNPRMVKLLLESKALPNNPITVGSILKTMIWRKDSIGALDVAAEKGFLEISKLLVHSGALLSTHLNKNPLTDEKVGMIQKKRVKMLKSVMPTNEGNLNVGPRKGNVSTNDRRVVSSGTNRTKRWLIVICLILFVIIVVLSTSSVLNYLINIQWTEKSWLRS